MNETGTETTPTTGARKMTYYIYDYDGSDHGEANEYECDCGHDMTFPLAWNGKTYCDECLAEELAEPIMDVALELWAGVERAEVAVCNVIFECDGDGNPIRIYIETGTDVESRPFKYVENAIEMRKLQVAQEEARRRGWTPKVWTQVAEILKEAQKEFHAAVNELEAK